MSVRVNSWIIGISEGTLAEVFLIGVLRDGKEMLASRTLFAALASLVTIYPVTVSVSAHSAQAGSQDLIGRARGSYYNVTRQGFNGFQAAIVPNWEVTLGPTATVENLKLFRAMRFSMTVDANGAVTLRHEVADPEKTRLEPYVTQIHGNVQRLVAGFFGAWARFMVNSPFPETESEFKIEDLGKEYHVSYNTQSSDALLTMTNDLLIVEWKLTGPRAKRTIKPLFQKTAEGLLLSGYKSIFEPVGEGIKTTLDFLIEYQDVSGMKLPHKIRIKGMHGIEPVEAELSFTQYVLNPR